MGQSMTLIRFFLLTFCLWSALEWWIQEEIVDPDSVGHSEVVLLAVRYRQQASACLDEAHHGAFPVADIAPSLLSQPLGMLACAELPTPLRQCDSCCSYMSMQC